MCEDCEEREATVEYYGEHLCDQCHFYKASEDMMH